MVELEEAAASVVEYAGDDHAEPVRVGRFQHLEKGRIAAEQGIDDVVVVRVIAVVGGRGEDGVEVDGVDAQRLEVIELLDDAEQIAALEAVVRRRRVPRLQVLWLGYVGTCGKAVGEDLVKDGVFDPLGGVNVRSHRKRQNSYTRLRRLYCRSEFPGIGACARLQSGQNNVSILCRWKVDYGAENAGDAAAGREEGALRGRHLPEHRARRDGCRPAPRRAGGAGLQDAGGHPRARQADSGDDPGRPPARSQAAGERAGRKEAADGDAPGSGEANAAPGRGHLSPGAAEQGLPDDD